MKKLYAILIISFIGFVGNAQIVNIPDPILKNALLVEDLDFSVAYNQSGQKIIVDANNDNEIQESEALQVYKIIFWGYENYFNLQDLTGIESFTNLTILEIQGTALSVVNLSGLPNLNNLELDDNALTSVALSNLNALSTVSLNYNFITSLTLSGLPNLTDLYCGNNDLTSLNLSGLTNLQAISLQNNQLNSIVFPEYTGDPNISLFLLLEANLFESLSFPNVVINEFRGGYNPNLKYLNVKESPSLSNLQFPNCPVLEYICTRDAHINTIQSMISSYGYINCHVNSYCNFTPGGTFYTIQGTSRIDLNNNGCDSNDIIYPNLKLNIVGENFSGYSITNATGNYTIPLEEGTYSLTPILENPNYFNLSPTTVNVTFPDAISPFTQDFCITANETHNDLEVIFLPISPARPGFDAYYKIVYKNKGNTIQNGNISLAFEDNLQDFISSTPFVNSQNTNILHWNFSNLQPFESREISLTMNINSPTESPAVNGGDQLTFSAAISPLENDELPFDNNTTLKQIVVNSFDPNDKTCIEGTSITPSMVGQYVHYVIRFENTGTFAAENIVVKDIIDMTKFDITTLIPMNASHSFYTRISNTNQVEFIFENINLPFDDANNDGYVAFKIKTKPTLVVGDSFTNSASIYFDYNFPIVTDPFTTTVQALGNQDFEFNSVFSLSPVPTKNTLTITTKESVVMSSASIYNMLGQLVQVNTNPTETIDVSGLKSGSYFIKILSNKGTATGKFIKE